MKNGFLSVVVKSAAQCALLVAVVVMMVGCAHTVKEVSYGPFKQRVNAVGFANVANVNVPQNLKSYKKTITTTNGEPLGQEVNQSTTASAGLDVGVQVDGTLLTNVPPATLFTAPALQVTPIEENATGNVLPVDEIVCDDKVSGNDRGAEEAPVIKAVVSVTSKACSKTVVTEEMEFTTPAEQAPAEEAEPAAHWVQYSGGYYNYGGTTWAHYEYCPVRARMVLLVCARPAWVQPTGQYCIYRPGRMYAFNQPPVIFHGRFYSRERLTERFGGRVQIRSGGENRNGGFRGRAGWSREGQRQEPLRVNGNDRRGQNEKGPGETPRSNGGKQGPRIIIQNRSGNNGGGGNGGSPVVSGKTAPPGGRVETGPIR